MYVYVCVCVCVCVYIYIHISKYIYIVASSKINRHASFLKCISRKRAKSQRAHLHFYPPIWPCPVFWNLRNAWGCDYSQEGYRLIYCVCIQFGRPIFVI